MGKYEWQFYATRCDLKLDCGTDKEKIKVDLCRFVKELEISKVAAGLYWREKGGMQKQVIVQLWGNANEFPHINLTINIIPNEIITQWFRWELC